MKTIKEFKGPKRTAKVIENKAGLFCAVVSGSDVKSPVKGKAGVQLHGCRKGEEGKKKSLEIAEKLANATKLPTKNK